MADYRQRMVNSPKSRKVLDAVIDAALDDDHKHQAAAWKLIMDRIMPVGAFEKEAGALKQSAITINITGVGEEGTTIDAEDVTDVDTPTYTVKDVE